MRGFARRLSSSLLRRTPDVDAHGLCAGGLVRIAEVAGSSKGLGAFAAAPLAGGLEIGRYAGEVITLGEMLTRYGGLGSDAADEYEASNAQAEWIAERRTHGIGVTGTYIFNAGQCPVRRRDVLIDGEDLRVSNWTRYLNHSTTPNLDVSYEVLPPEQSHRLGTPVVRFITRRPIAAGGELLFDYGDGLNVSDLLGFED